MEPDETIEAELEESPPPKGRIGLALKTIFRTAIVLVIGAAIGGGTVRYIIHRHQTEMMKPSALPAAPGKKVQRYQCPMHPAIIMDHPGDCPICGMKLVPMKEENAPTATPAKPAERKLLFYRSPMDPKQTSPVFRKDEMGMDYLPVYEDEQTPAKEAKLPGLATVTIDSERQQLIGLRTVKVVKGPFGGSWRTTARIQIDPTRVRKINVKVEGFVERSFVDFVGKPVRKGQPLFTLYSPEMLSAQNEYLLAVKTRDALAASGGLADNGDSIVASARRKLQLWDISGTELERLEQTGHPKKAITIVSPIAGIVTVKNIVEGARLSPGDAPYEITDLGMVWAMADAYESDLAKVKTRMKATMTMQTYPGRTFKGVVDFIDPILDPKTRTAKVHLHFPNREGLLKPEMFGEVEINGTSHEGLTIPTDAVIRSGAIDVVFVALGNGKFRPVEVGLGEKRGDQVEVRSGLTGDEEVVTRANFLVDSESRLRSSLSEMSGK